MNGVEPIDAEIVRTCVREMMEKGYMDICTIDKLLKLTRGVPDGRAYERLRALHCVSFRNMTPALRLEIPRLLQQVLEGPPLVYLYQPPATNIETRLLS